MIDFRDATFEAVDKVMAADPRAMLLTNDMGAMGLDQARQRFPGRVVNVGIAEQNLMSVAAGLALEGRRVFVFGIASHLTGRAYEQMKLDICVLGLDVVILGVGGGLSYGADGPTHQALDDLALMRTLPGMAVYNPADGHCARACILAAVDAGGPAYVRLDRERLPFLGQDTGFTQGFRLLSAGQSMAVFATGCMVPVAASAVTLLAGGGINACLVDFYRLHPVDDAAVLAVIADKPLVATVEEHAPMGGLGSVLADLANRNGLTPAFSRHAVTGGLALGVSDRAQIRDSNGMTAEALAACWLNRLHRGKTC